MNFFTKALLVLLLGAASVATAQVAERINLNTADAATLDRVMDGVGPAKAAAIVEHRRVHGPFRSIDQLINVKGIGPATLEANRTRVMVAGAPAAATAARPAARTTAPTTARPLGTAPRVN